MERSPETSVPATLDSRLTIAYGSHAVLGLVILGAMVLQLAINIYDWANEYIEPLAPGDYDNLAEGYMALYRFVSMWPFIGAIFGIGRALGDIPRDMRLGLLLFLALMPVILGMLSLGPLVAISAMLYVIAALYYSGKWFVYTWRARRKGQSQPIQ